MNSEVEAAKIIANAILVLADRIKLLADSVSDSAADERSLSWYIGRGLREIAEAIRDK